MNTALDANQRAQLERLVGQCRAILETDLEKQAAGRYGIDADGTIAPEDTLRLDPSALAARREIVAIVAHLQSEGAASGAAVARLLREAVFTHLNRLIAIRIAEALGLLPPSLAEGRRSQGFRELLELAPLLAGDDTGGYWVYLQLCGDELAGDVPTLFDPRNPLLALVPSPGAVDELTSHLADPATAALWTAPDCLGWVYQFFNTKDEREAMREESAAPRDSRELAVRNQFFTPRYVVDFLVQNSLGRRLMESDPESPLLDDLPLLVDPPAQQGETVSLGKVSVLDPACGSGHFLLAAYDVLERAWHHAGVQASEAASDIVRSLWGIDIDPRCTQVAAAAVIFRARRSNPHGTLPRPNIICPRSLPPATTGLSEVLAALPASQRRLVRRLTDALADAPVLGPLLKIEERLAAEVKAAAIGGPALPGTFADALSGETLQALENELLDNLSKVASSVMASPAERLLAAEADDAVRFVQALQRRYDAVFMNPPFGEPVSGTKPYLKATYPWMPKIYDLLAAFVGRGLELCTPTGYLGAITSRAGLFLTSFTQWRSQVLLDKQLISLADLGFGVMEQALVEAAAYVVSPRQPELNRPVTFVRLLKDTNRSAALAEATRNARAGEDDSRIFRVAIGDLRLVPGWPVAYWMSPSIRRLFIDLPSIEGNAAEVRQGLATADDFQFVRAFWEVDPRRIAHSREETFTGKRWCPFAKGGEYSPYWSDVHLVVDWEGDGVKIKAEVDRKYPYLNGKVEWVVKNQSYYFRPGLTWPLRTASGFSPRVLPQGCVFGHKGPAIISDTCSPLLLAAWLTSRPAQALLASLLAAADETTSGTASKSYEVGLIQRLPWPGYRISAPAQATCEALAAEVTASRAEADANDETSRRFMAPAAVGISILEAAEANLQRLEEEALRALDVAAEIDTILTRELGFDEEALVYLDEEIGPHAARYSDRPPDPQLFAKWYTEELEALIDHVVEVTSGRVAATKAYVADRRLELIAHALEITPQRLVQTRREMAISPPGQIQRTAEDLMSYLFGCALGRWDIRIGRNPSHARSSFGLFDPVPLCPPGMLVGDNGLPTNHAPSGYPLDLPPSHLLVDQPGHKWDVESAIHGAITALSDDSDRTLAELIRVLGRQSLRGSIRRDFFKAHLRRYSKSRRKAPIYWPLYVPSGMWGIWVYAPALSRETLFAITQAAAGRLEAAETEIRRLQRERDAGGAGRSARDVAKALEAEERLVGELRMFRDEAERIASLGWEPDLDDGLILCAAPLAGLLPAWKDAAAARKEIKAGNYPWAAVSRWATQL